MAQALTYTLVHLMDENTQSVDCISIQEAHYIGLFGANSGKIANVGILDSYFYGQLYRGNWVGGVCGYNTNKEQSQIAIIQVLSEEVKL